MIPYNLLTTIISLPEKPVEWPKSYTVIGVIFVACGIGLIFRGFLTSDPAWIGFGALILFIYFSLWVMTNLIPNIRQSSSEKIPYEQQKRDYQETLDKYQEISIAKTYKKDNQYFMVLDNKDNTVIEITEEAYDIIAPNKPVKQYLTVLEKE